MVRLCLTTLMTVAVMSAGCSPIVGPVSVEAAVPHDLRSAQYRLATVELQTVADLGAGTGTRFDIVGEYSITNDFIRANIDFDDDDAQQTLKEESRALGAEGPLAPRLRYNPLADRYEAEDFDTLVYLSAFYAFENIWDYYAETLGDGTRATNEKTIVSLYGGTLASASLPIPLSSTHDNAEYLPTGDIFALKQVRDQEGIPLAVNWGVLAHEFFHRVFFHQVQGEGGALKYFIDAVWPDEVDGGREAGERGATLSFQLLRGVNEGLADIFAAGMTGRPNIFFGSDEDRIFNLHSRYRDVEGDFANELTYDALTNDVEDDTGQKKCGRIPVSDDDDSSFNIYCLGTLVARVLYDTAGWDPVLLQNRVLPQVLKILRPLGEDIVDESEAEDGRLSFNLPMLFNRVYDGLDADLRVGYCASLAVKFAPLVEQVTGCTTTTE